VTINGVMFPKGKAAGDKPVPCTIVGYAWVTGLGVGGGPIIPPAQPGEPPRPEHPIVLPPTPPIEGQPPIPTHPIVLPDPPTSPPDVPPQDNMVKPPPPEGGWGWNPVYGWGYFPGTGSAGPKRR
jgi:hypothetical protein